MLLPVQSDQDSPEVVAEEELGEQALTDIVGEAVGEIRLLHADIRDLQEISQGRAVHRGEHPSQALVLHCFFHSLSDFRVLNFVQAVHGVHCPRGDDVVGVQAALEEADRLAPEAVVLILHQQPPREQLVHLDRKSVV